jgi:hypothetical protein
MQTNIGVKNDALSPRVGIAADISGRIAKGLVNLQRSMDGPSVCERQVQDMYTSI